MEFQFEEIVVIQVHFFKDHPAQTIVLWNIKG